MEVTIRLASAPSCLALAALLLAACSSTSAESRKKAESELFDARQEYRQTIDGLFRAYGGTVAGASAPAPQAPGSPDEGSSVVGHVVSEADRSYFERQCLAVGRGERPFTLTSKMQTFLDAPDNARGCRKAAELQSRIRDLEAKTQKP